MQFQLSPRFLWPWFVVSVLTLVLSLASQDWTWTIVGGLFVFSSGGQLYRYYTWPRRIRRQS